MYRPDSWQAKFWTGEAESVAHCGIDDKNELSSDTAIGLPTCLSWQQSVRPKYLIFLRWRVCSKSMRNQLAPVVPACTTLLVMPSVPLSPRVWELQELVIYAGQFVV